MSPIRVLRSTIAIAALSLASWLGGASPSAAQALPDYKLSPGDQIEVSVWKEPELSKTVIVRPDGKFSYPLAGEITAASKTVSQVQSEITARLKQFIPEPVVTAALTVLDGNRIYVIGQVGKPGTYVMNPRLNVLQALAVAGGMTPFANADGIMVMRGIGAQQRILRFRYGDVSKGRDVEQNIQLEAGDVVIVP